MMMEPLVFEPYLRPQVWGGRKLGHLFGRVLPDPDTLYGESWEISPHPLHVSRVAEGPHAGRTLTELCRAATRDLFGSSPPAECRFPLLVKLLDCRERLSIQVHPSDELARQLAGDPSGKCEAWVVLQADATARIYAGFKPGVDRADVQRRLQQGTVGEALHAFCPQPGECVYLPAGTVHAVGGGVVLAEIQQASDATFRLFDWNRVGLDGRPRTLHVEQALQAIDWQAGPVGPLVPVVSAGAPPGARSERIVQCPYFHLDRLTLERETPMETQGGLTLWMVIEGAAELRTPSGYCRTFGRGGTVLVPAATESWSWRPAEAETAVTLLRVSLPPPV